MATFNNHIITVMTLLRIVIALTFIASAFTKAVNPDATAETVRGYCAMLGIDSLGFISFHQTGLLLCAAELALGAVAMSRKAFLVLLPAYIIVFAGFTWLTYLNLSSPFGSMESCGCFGEIIHLDATQTLVKNIILLSITIIIFAYNRMNMKASSSEGNMENRFRSLCRNHANYAKFAIICIAAFSASCGRLMMTDEERHLEEALTLAKGNRTELEKVLNHYADNPERLQAAQWLISNMPLHHTKTGPELAKYRRYFEEAADHSRNPITIKKSLDSIYGAPDLSRLDIIYDIETLDSAFIVENIDAAFEARERWPWGKNVRWEDFLEFVLPYRLGDEPLTSWRKPIMEEYGDLIDSIAGLPEAATPRMASDLLYKEWIWRKGFKWTSRLPVGPRIGPEIVEWKTGACREKADGMCYLLRAAGLPAALHIAPMRGDLNDTHSWGAIYDSDGSPWLPEQRTDSAWKSKVPAAKVLSETFSINRNAPVNSINTRLANTSLINPLVRDETEWYLPPAQRIPFKVALDQLEDTHNGDTLYIALSSRMDWVPVGMGIARNDSVDFGFVGDRTVCVAGIMKDGKFQPKGFPFKTTRNADNSLHFLTPGESKPINIYSKFNLTVGDFTWRMVDGCFEVSDTPDFALVDTIHLIKESPKRLLTTVCVDADKIHRYVRYKSADKTFCNVAMIAFYENADDTIPLGGRIINAPGFHAADDMHDFRNAWDGDPYTSVDLRESSGGWTGLDLGSPRKIEKIVYAPRNRGNYIHKGFRYELFYYDSKRGWISLGQQKAGNYMISMEAPAGALLYIHCLDAGKDERIFEYDPDRDLQIYW